MKLLFHTYASALVAAMSLDYSSANAIPDECGTSLCTYCVLSASTVLITSTNTSPRCKYVEDGKWDDSIQKCIDEHCSTEEEVEDGCVEGLQAWIDAESVDVNDFSIVDRVDLPVCNKAGGNEAADDDGMRCDAVNPPEKITGGKITISKSDPNTGKVFASMCVDEDDQSLITYVCVSEEDCSDYGAVFYDNSDASTFYVDESLFGEKDVEDDDVVDDDETTSSEDSTSASFDEIIFTDSSAMANSVSISGCLAMVLYYTLQYVACI